MDNRYRAAGSPVSSMQVSKSETFNNRRIRITVAVGPIGRGSKAWIGRRQASWLQLKGQKDQERKDDRYLIKSTSR